MNRVEFSKMDLYRTQEPPLLMEEGKYNYTIKIAVIQDWLMDITADDENHAYEKAKEIIKDSSWQDQADLDDEHDEVITVYDNNDYGN